MIRGRTSHRLEQLLQRFCCPDNIFRPSTNAEIIRQINPANYARRIHQEFCGPGNVVSLHSCSGVQEIVSPNDVGVGVGKEGIRVSFPFAQIPGDPRLVDADCYRANTQFFDLRQVILDTPQLGVAEGSPVAAIENQQYAFRYTR
jgi:hypothetical protein